MEWLDDGDRLSINHLKHVVETFKSWDDFQKAIQDLPYIQELGTVLGKLKLAVLDVSILL